MNIFRCEHSTFVRWWASSVSEAICLWWIYSFLRHPSKKKTIFPGELKWWWLRLMPMEERSEFNLCFRTMTLPRNKSNWWSNYNAISLTSCTHPLSPTSKDNSRKKSPNGCRPTTSNSGHAPNLESDCGSSATWRRDAEPSGNGELKPLAWVSIGWTRQHPTPFRSIWQLNHPQGEQPPKHRTQIRHSSVEIAAVSNWDPWAEH